MDWPIFVRAPATPPVSDDSKTDLGSSSYLIVEDDEFASNLIRRVLEKIGATDIASAANGVEALEFLAAATPPWPKDCLRRLEA